MLTRLHISFGLFLRSMLICVIVVLFFASSGVTYAAPVPLTSANWAGVLATNPSPQRFTSVIGTFTLPCTQQLNQSTNIGEVAFWVGLGGRNNQPLIQTVIRAPSPLTPDLAFGEVVTATGVQTFPLIKSGHLVCGDRYTLGVVEKSGFVFFSINTSHPRHSYSAVETTVLPFPNGALTAEWIAERSDECTGNVACYNPLAKFGTIDFSNCITTLSPFNTIRPLANLHYSALNMIETSGTPPKQTVLSYGHAVREGNQVDATAAWNNYGA